MAIMFNTSELELDGVTSINVSDIQQDPNTNQMVRKLDFYIDPPSAINRRPVLTVVVTAPSKQSIVITIPSGVTF